MTKSTGDGATVTVEICSLCINDLEYRSPFGRASTYNDSYGSFRFFLGGTDDGNAGPKSSSEDSPSSPLALCDRDRFLEGVSDIGKITVMDLVMWWLLQQGIRTASGFQKLRFALTPKRERCGLGGRPPWFYVEVLAF